MKWYAENQELLDKGTRQVKQRDDEIHKLKMRIEELQTEVGNVNMPGTARHNGTHEGLVYCGFLFRFNDLLNGEVDLF